ncbi:MAG: hypothetical protein ACRDT0_23935 [Pseudonocardiaceae bacterium]
MNMLAELALALAVPAYMTIVAAVVLAFQRPAPRDSHRCPRRGAGAR